ncbi:hypothetical protein NIES2101_08940 [Calothrix sp. HK-06]|nr:hypothetical protein NIES2101_08940 [Calothrix sp. HK-06]
MFKCKILLPIIGLSLATVGTCITSSQAQALIKFTNDYDFAGGIVLVPEKNLLIGPGEGTSTGADFNLNSFESLVYSNLSEAVNAIATGSTFRYDSNPLNVGVSDEPNGGITFFGEGSDKIFGSLVGIDIVDPVNLTAKTIANIFIKGGAGRFQNVTGTGTVVGIVGSDPNAATNPGRLTVNLSFDVPKSIPENNNSLGIAFATLCTGAMLKKAYRVKQIVK